MSENKKLPWFVVERWLDMSLDEKIELSKVRIRQFYEYMGGRVYISDSGGKDSLVLRELVREIYPDVVVVHSIALTDPDTIKYLGGVPNMKFISPKDNLRDIIDRYGYPVVSKEVSKNISRYRVAREKGKVDVMNQRMYGIKKDGSKGVVGVIPKKWRYLVDAPFKISDRCCDLLKKKPFEQFERKTGLRPFLGILSTESTMRSIKFMENGCTILKKGKERSMPISFWYEDDVWAFIRGRGLEYSPIYDKGENRTGCYGCMFGCQYEQKPNRFQRMWERHPKIYEYYMDELGFAEVLGFMGVEYKPYVEVDRFPFFKKK